MDADHHPMKPEHVPHYLAAADGSDYLFTAMIVLVIVVVLLLGVAYFTLHALPERMPMPATPRSFSLSPSSPF